MNAPSNENPASELPLLLGDPGDAALTERLVSVVCTPPRWMGPAIALALLGTLAGFCAMAYTVVTGIGVWGNNIPVAWAFEITNFVWWIGIGHAGTFISAILLLLDQRWRTSINRIAEAMTLFAVLNAAIFPLLHLGRPWFFYWLLPYPATMGVWPQFRSALPWDVAAIGTYFTVSLLFWYLGLMPDLAAVRDRAPERWRRRIYGLFALGWRGTARQWNHYRVAYGLLAGLATPLVISVHSVVSMDFAITLLPGWHSSIFPPYFVAGAIYSGFAMVLTLIVPLRRLYRLHDLITEVHLDAMAKMLLVTGWVVVYAYVVEPFMAFWSGNRYEAYTFLFNRPAGPYALLYWASIAINSITPQLFWSRRMRRNASMLFVASILINLGMWLERYVLVVTSQQRDWLPSSWSMYHPTWVDLTILLGTLSLFLLLFLLFLRFVPFIPLSELKALGHGLSQQESRTAAAQTQTGGRNA